MLVHYKLAETHQLVSHMLVNKDKWGLVIASLAGALQ